MDLWEVVLQTVVLLGHRRIWQDSVAILILVVLAGVVNQGSEWTKFGLSTLIR